MAGLAVGKGEESLGLVRLKPNRSWWVRVEESLMARSSLLPPEHDDKEAVLVPVQVVHQVAIATVLRNQIQRS
ncbi:hypothetical protein EYF80_024963 [Liparis tanakae]|uniref:Uncharacterized protein n=1 Tax=Liparis tanakae TaxID=230148 RepID=A0A4Z2HFX0_9TELE|nr:hypothetical protein EYF80_024963 [Liparis tanakae]